MFRAFDVGLGSNADIRADKLIAIECLILLAEYASQLSQLTTRRISVN